jgi:hypothetical protein
MAEDEDRRTRDLLLFAIMSQKCSTICMQGYGTKQRQQTNATVRQEAGTLIGTEPILAPDISSQKTQAFGLSRLDDKYKQIQSVLRLEVLRSIPQKRCCPFHVVSRSLYHKHCSRHPFDTLRMPTANASCQTILVD